MVGLYLGHGELLMKLDIRRMIHILLLCLLIVVFGLVICIPQLSFVSPGRLRAKDLLSNDSLQYKYIYFLLHLYFIYKEDTYFKI